MSRLGRAKWPEFHLDRYTFLVWVRVWFRMCADKLPVQDSHLQHGVALGQWYRRPCPRKCSSASTLSSVYPSTRQTHQRS